MSKITPTSTPLGLAAPVLDEVTLKQLPSFLPSDARQALQTPSSDPILAAVSVGQLLRAGELRGPSRARLQTWLRDRNEAFVTLIAQQGEQLIEGAIGELAAVASSPQARALTDDQREVTEAEAPDAEEPRGWLRGCILQRDQAESLLVVLGKIALESPVEEVSELAAGAERRLLQRARAFDEIWETLVPMLGDHLTPELQGDPWLSHAARLQVTLPWLALLRGRQLGQRLQETPAAQSPRAVVLELKLPPRKQPPRAMALAANEEGTSRVTTVDPRYVRSEPLHLEIARPEDPQAEGDFTLSIWVSDGKKLDLSGDAVSLWRLDGAELKPVWAERKPRRWWGYFQGEGRFTLKVKGLPVTIDLSVLREV